MLILPILSLFESQVRCLVHGMSDGSDAQTSASLEVYLAIAAAERIEEFADGLIVGTELKSGFVFVDRSLAVARVFQRDAIEKA